MQFGVQRRPEFAQPVEVHPEIPTDQVLVGVQDHLEAVAVHPPAGVASGNVRQPVSGLEAKPPPDVGVLGTVQIGALIAGTLDADPFEPGTISRARASGPGSRQSVPGGDRSVRHNPAAPPLLAGARPGVGSPPRERRPVRRQFGPDPRQEAVAVQAAGAMAGRKEVHLAGGFERGGRDGVQSFVHAVELAKSFHQRVGNAGFGEALARSRQAGHSPQGGCWPW